MNKFCRVLCVAFFNFQDIDNKLIIIVDELFKIMFAKFQSDLSKIVEDMLKKEQYLLLKQWKLRNVWFKLSFYILLPKTCKYSLLNDKKNAQIIWSKDLVSKRSFGYRVAHHGYLLTSCPGHSKSFL